MATFIYEAYNKNNRIVHGEYEATSTEEVVQYLNKHYLTPLSVKQGRAPGLSKKVLSFDLFDSISTVDIVFLVRNLSTTIKAGLSIVESLDILIQDTKKKLLKSVLQGVQAMIKNGQTLSAGFEAYRESFPPIFIGMIKAGEVSGQLDKTLAELARYLSKEYSLRGKVKTALTYPIILLVAATFVVVLMLVFVLPRLTRSFLQSGVELPWITKAFLFVSQVLTWSFTVDLIALAGLIWFFAYFRTTKTGKKFFFSVASHTPVARDLVKKVALVRFARTFGNLVGSGLSVIDSLTLSAESINNVHYSAAIEAVIQDVQNGIPVSEALGKYKELFPTLLINLIIVGERTGSLEEILKTFADFYEEEVDNTLKELTAVLEPVLLLFMGLLIGALAISIILPIYQLVGHFV